MALTTISIAMSKKRNTARNNPTIGYFIKAG
jgi:hypothetical protein